MKKKIEIERITIPDISECDVLATIQKAKQILRSTQVKKLETNIWNTMKQIMILQGWKSLCIQALVVLSMLYFAWVEADIEMQIEPYSLLIVSGAILSVTACGEVLRGDIYQMCELESACAISRQRLFIWKMLLLDISSIIGIIMISCLLANRYELEVFPLLSGGCIPFLLLNAIALQFQVYTKTFTTFLLLYASVFCIFLYCGLFLILYPSFFHYMQNWASILLLLIAGYTIVLIVYQYKKELML